MIWNLLHIAVMSMTFLYMFNKAQFAATRLVSLIPLATVLVDACCLRADFMAVPVLAVLMEAARLTVLGCCVLAMKKDARLVRARSRQRAMRKMRLHTAVLENTAAPSARYA